MEKVGLLEQYGVKVNDALEFWGDMQAYDESLKELKDSLSGKLKNLEYYKNTSDYENYGILAHSIKSECKYLGFMNDAQVFLEHEMAGKESNATFINDNFEKLENTIKQIISLLDRYFTQDKNKNILIADDSNIIINFIDHNIGSQYQILKANNGKEAIEILQNSDIYAMLLDLNMPSVNGFEVLDYMKENSLLEKIPVIIITGDDSNETVKKAFTYPILDVLNKPFNEENIKRVLTSIQSFYEKR